MRKYLWALIAGFCLLGACSKGNGFVTDQQMNAVDTSEAVKLVGYFANGPYGTASGYVKLVVKDNRFKLVLENVSISDGPDLHVYLSKEVIPVNFIDLGQLKSLSGTQEYDIAGTPDFSQYKYALIHCKSFDHLFGSAFLV